MDVPLVANVIALEHDRQMLIDKCVLKANNARIPLDYNVNKEVLKKEHLGLSNKLKLTWIGHYCVTRPHTNGMVIIPFSPHETKCYLSG